jgi:hypothetical protein
MGGAGSGAAALAFDAAWQVYVQQFRLWKGEDAMYLEGELVRAAGAMEASMLQKLRECPGLHKTNVEAIRTQVTTDHALLQERIGQLTGRDGVARMDAHLIEVRQAVVEAVVTEAAAADGITAAAPDADARSNNEQMVYELLR